MIVSETKGDLFEGVAKSKSNFIVIPHVCNDIGAWGSGFVIPLGEKYPGAKAEYEKWNKIISQKHRIGTLDKSYDFKVADDGFPSVCVYNMIAQRGIISRDNPRPLDYGSLAHTMVLVSKGIELDELLAYQDHKLELKPEIHAPRFGSDRAGGDWTIIRELIEVLWCRWPTHIYYL